MRRSGCLYVRACVPALDWAKTRWGRDDFWNDDDDEKNAQPLASMSPNLNPHLSLGTVAEVRRGRWGGHGHIHVGYLVTNPRAVFVGCYSQSLEERALTLFIQLVGVIESHRLLCTFNHFSLHVALQTTFPLTFSLHINSLCRKLVSFACYIIDTNSNSPAHSFILKPHTQIKK